MPKIFPARLISQKVVNDDYRLVSFLPLIKQKSTPLAGQFYMIQVSEGTDPLLKRPFSIFSFEEGLLHFLYRIVGKGTRLLSNMSEGRDIEMIGPLGNSYPDPRGSFIALAGGSGIASIYCLLYQYPQMGKLFYGAKDGSSLVLIEELRRLSKELHITTDNGSIGLKMTPFDALKETGGYNGLPIYACGPKEMLRSISKWCSDNDQLCYLSLEEHMACGIGACLSCVVKTVEGLKSVCKDGTVFDSKAIIWG